MRMTKDKAKKMNFNNFGELPNKGKSKNGTLICKRTLNIERSDVFDKVGEHIFL